MRSFLTTAVVAAAVIVTASDSFGQVVLRAMSDNRSGNISVLANGPSGDPRQSGFNVDPGQNDLDTFDFLLTETDTRQGCPGTNASATIDHFSTYPQINSQNACRGFRASTIASGVVNVSACGAGQTHFANFDHNMNQVIRIENAPAAGAPIRVRATAAASGGATSAVRVVRPNGTNLLNLTSGAVNTVVNLPNGEYTIIGQFTNGNSSRSTSGATTKSAALTVGFWKECNGDLDGDGVVGIQDLSVLLSAFGVDNQGDLNGDGTTSIQDLANLLSAFGTTCPA